MGTRGVLRSPGIIGGSELIAVVTLAVQYAVPDEDELAAVGVHVTAAPMLELPLENWTVPVGPTPLLLVFTCAVIVTVAPDVMVPRGLCTAIEVAACVKIMERALLVLAW